MARPKKCRRIGFIPENLIFNPSCPYTTEVVVLSFEELESIRLNDYLKMDQESASVEMNVSRGTFQRILIEAHQKLADCILNGKRLQIGGGNFELEPNYLYLDNDCKIKEEESMKIAVANENGNVSKHFGHCEEFVLFELNDGVATQLEVLHPEGSGHGALPAFLAQHEVDLVIVGGLGMGAFQKLNANDIQVITSINGTIEEAIETYKNGQYDSKVAVHASHNKQHNHEHGNGHGHGEGKGQGRGEGCCGNHEHKHEHSHEHGKGHGHGGGCCGKHNH